MADNFPPPEEAVRFLSRKKIIPTENWDDLKHGEHSHSFTVAHSCEADVLGDIQSLIKKAQEKGDSLGTFRAGMLDLMREKGWYGGNGHTGEDTKYINWRIKIIYTTNMRTAYAAARYRTQLAAADLRPIWVYKSMLTGEARRQEHIALHNKAFRYDDPFWETFYPPNGWGCKCSVETQSESGAEKRHVDILKSDADGNPPDIGVNWKTFTGDTWAYNGALESLSPDFGSYQDLKNIVMDDGKTALRHVIERYRADMEETKMSLAEMRLIVGRMEKQKYNSRGILYQIGNLDGDRFAALIDEGIEDSRVMISDDRIWHALVSKNEGQKIPKSLYGDLYKMLQSPEEIYEDLRPEHARNAKELVFVKDAGDGKKLVAALRKRLHTALQILTMGYSTYTYTGAEFKKIWPPPGGN